MLKLDLNPFPRTGDGLTVKPEGTVDESNSGLLRRCQSSESSRALSSLLCSGV
jgi:hypothetical protein